MGPFIPIFFLYLLTTHLLLLYPFFIIDNIFTDLNVGEIDRPFSLRLMEYEDADLRISTPDKPSKNCIFIIRRLFFQIEVLNKSGLHL